MNQCLIAKWIWKIDKGSKELWYRLLKNKYMKRNGFFGSAYQGTSQFWRGLHKVKHLYQWGAEYHVKKGDKVRFWHDSWRGGVPLKIQFQSIFEICNKPDALVKDFWKEGEWDIPLRRSLFGASLAEWNELMTVLHEVQLDEQGQDKVVWALEKSSEFSTKSLYNCLTHGGVKDKLNDILWKCKVPLKVKVFLWQAWHNKLPTAESLVKRNWQGSPSCCLCGKVETVDHILFECVFAQYVWCCIRDAFQL
jgi:hypothetical protein